MQKPLTNEDKNCIISNVYKILLKGIKMKNVDLEDMYVPSIQKQQSNESLVGFAYMAVVFVLAYGAIALFN